MSYARKGPDSDVYVYEHVRPIDNMDRTEIYLRCCFCELSVDSGGISHAEHEELSFQGMLRHLERHIAAGHKVPEYVLEKLRNKESA